LSIAHIFIDLTKQSG
jgi:hypothetical protein